MEDKAWHISPFTKQTATPSEKKYSLVLAAESDTVKVLQFYAHHPVERYGVAKVEVIVNPEFNRAFSLELSRLQEKANNPAFMPKWDQMTGADQRREVIGAWKGLTQPYADPAYPAVSLMPAWHGTRPTLLDSLFRVGYSNLSFTDDGYFGKGLYSTWEAEYAHRVYSKGALIVNWIASFSMLPVIAGDMDLLRGKGNYGNYDGHFVPVAPRDPMNPNETVYYPCSLDQTAQYHEIVVFQTAACLPRYLVTLEANLVNSLRWVTPDVPVKKVETVNASYGTEELPKMPVMTEKTLLGSVALDIPVKVETVSAHYSAEELPKMPVTEENKLPSSEMPGPSSAYYSQEELPPVWRLSENDLQRLWSEGQTAVKTSRYQDARQKLESLIEGLQATNPGAEVLLGWLYGNVLYPLNETKAQQYYAKAYGQKERLIQQAQTDDPETRYQLSLLFIYGTQATPEEKQQGIEQLTLAAKQNHAGAKRELGLLYQSGKGIALNAETAVYCYQAAADQGDARAMYHLAACFIQGFGAAKNPEQAFEWFRRAAHLGDALAQNSLGLRYEHGNGVKQDPIQAAQYYQQSAAQGYGLAQVNLAIMYETGQPGVEKDLVKAAQYYHLASSQGIARAQNNLAGFYDKGLGGMPQDFDEAFRLYKAAAAQGYARGQYNLGLCYEMGNGTAKDLQQAKHYYTLAANAKERISPEAQKRLAQLEQTLSVTTTSPAATTPPPSGTTPFWSQPGGNTPTPKTLFQPPQNKPF